MGNEGCSHKIYKKRLASLLHKLSDLGTCTSSRVFFAVWEGGSLEIYCNDLLLNFLGLYQELAAKPQNQKPTKKQTVNIVDTQKFVDPDAVSLSFSLDTRQTSESNEIVLTQEINCAPKQFPANFTLFRVPEAAVISESEFRSRAALSGEIFRRERKDPPKKSKTCLQLVLDFLLKRVFNFNFVVFN